MIRDEFWAMIDATRSGDDPSEHVEALQAALSRRTAADIIDFEKHMADLLATSYTWKLWGAAYLINGGCSDDGFDYFRGWLKWYEPYQFAVGATKGLVRIAL